MSTGNYVKMRGDAYTTGLRVKIQVTNILIFKNFFLISIGYGSGKATISPNFYFTFFLIEKTYQVRFVEAKKILSIKNDGEDL